MVARGFLQSDVMDAYVEMIVIAELPFSFVEKKGFRRFCGVACPMFKVPSMRKTVRQFLKMYDAQKQQLKNDLSAHRINLTIDTWTSVQNTNYMLQKFVVAIRNAVRYVRSSPQRLDYFKTSIEKEKLTCKGLVCMDVPTRWNSTYMMLDATLKFKNAFTRMAEDLNNPFMAYFKEPDEVVDEDGVVQTNSRQCRVGPPTDVDWNNATVFVRFLKMFYEVTLKVSASLHPTIHKTFHAVISIEKEIDKLFVAPQFATGSDAEKVLTALYVSK
ncbi:unnamed protein product [Prunus armeniaca]